MLALITVLASPAAATDEVRVRKVEFEGVEALRESLVRDHMLTRERSTLRFWKARPDFSEGVLVEDLRRVEQLYRDSGYYEAVVEGDFETRKEGRQVVVTVRVEEGEPVRLTALNLSIDGEAPIEADALAADLPLGVGSVFAVEQYQATRTAVLERLAEVGHPAARIRGGAEIVVESRSASIDWQVSPGPAVVFGEVRVEGLEKVGEKVVRREITIVEGEPYKTSVLRRSRNRLLRSRLFRFVSFLPDRPEPPPPDEQAATPEDRAVDGSEAAPAGESAPPASEDAAEAPATEVWPIAVRVEERPPRSIALGGGWASGLGPRGSVRWSHRNFLGDARRLGIWASGSPVEQLAGIRLQQPYVFDTRATLIVESLWRRRSRTSYDWNTIEFDIGPRWTFGPHWVLETGYRFGWTDISNITDDSNDVLRAQQRSGLLSGFGVRVRRAQLDRPTNPRRGTWVQLAVGTNLKALGSDFDWMRYEAEARGYLPLGPTVGAVRARWQAIDPLGSTSAAEVPLGERLFLGGPHTGRGFPFEKLGPLGAEGEPLGGVTSLLLSAEWRIPVWGPVVLVGFVDAGKVSLEPLSFDGSELGLGAGGGLAFTTPIGPVAFHLGYPIRPVEVSQNVRFAITIGHSF